MVLKEWQHSIKSCQNLAELEALRVQLIGKSGVLTLQLKDISHLTPEERRARGAELNEIKNTVLSLLEDKKASLLREDLEERLRTERLDITLPPRPQPMGKLHPLTRVYEEITTYFHHLGFQIASGPDIEDDELNFTALNIPPHHPARQAHDTFYMKEGPRLLRTHTSPVQIRVMRKQPPPLRVIIPGRAYRCDSDVTHTPLFHQVEILVVDRAIHMGHLKGCVIEFARHFFGIQDLPVRFRPSFFPFTEPSAEVDIGCTRDGNRLKIGHGKDWLEILGSGMVHPQVLRNCNLDPDVYQGFAVGMGMERLAMLKYGIPDIRDFYGCDVRWLNHYGFHPLGETQ